MIRGFTRDEAERRTRFEETDSDVNDRKPMTGEGLVVGTVTKSSGNVFEDLVFDASESGFGLMIVRS